MKMRNLAILVSAGSLVVALSGCGGGGKTPAPGAQAPGGTTGAAAVAGDPVKGKEVWSNTCASCHGADAKGMPGLGKSMVKPSEWLTKQDQAALVAFLKKGRSAADPENTTKVDMPPKGGNPALTEDDLNNVSSYIISIRGK